MLKLGKIICKFHCLAQASLTFNLAKCEFAKATVTYLGRAVGQGQVHPINAKVVRLKIIPHPKQAMSCVGFWEWLVIIGTFAEISPLYSNH